MSGREFYEYYDRENYEDIPLLTHDGICHPEIGLKKNFIKKRVCK